MPVLLLEDHDGVRAAIREGLSRHGVDVVAVGSIAEARDAVVACRPSLALVDLKLHGESGFDAIGWLTSIGVRSIALTTADDAMSMAQAIRRGACGYLLKDDPVVEVAAAILRAESGAQPVSPSMTHHLLSPLRPAPSALPYGLRVALQDERAVLAPLEGSTEATFRAPSHVALLHALAHRWSSDGPGDGRGWVDDDALCQAVWGAKHKHQGANNLNVLIFRIRAVADRAGLDKAFLDKRPGAVRLCVSAVWFG